MRHLTDEEIQAYLDGFVGELDPGLADHIRTCEQCRGALRDYRALYAGLADKSAFDLPRDLPLAVMSGLGLGRARARFPLPGDLVLVAGAVVAMLVAAVVLLDLEPLFEAVAAAGREIFELASPGLEAVFSGMTGPNHTLTIFVTGAAILFFIGVLDIVFNRRQPSLTGRRTR